MQTNLRYIVDLWLDDRCSAVEARLVMTSNVEIARAAYTMARDQLYPGRMITLSNGAMIMARSKPEARPDDRKVVPLKSATGPHPAGWNTPRGS